MVYTGNLRNILDFWANHKCERLKYDCWTAYITFHTYRTCNNNAYLQWQPDSNQIFSCILTFLCGTRQYHVRTNDQSKEVAPRQCRLGSRWRRLAGMGWSLQSPAHKLNTTKLLSTMEMLDQNSARSALARKPKCCEAGKEARWIAQLVRVGNEGSEAVRS